MCYVCQPAHGLLWIPLRSGNNSCSNYKGFVNMCLHSLAVRSVRKMLFVVNFLEGCREGGKPILPSLEMFLYIYDFSRIILQCVCDPEAWPLLVRVLHHSPFLCPNKPQNSSILSWLTSILGRDWRVFTAGTPDVTRQPLRLCSGGLRLVYGVYKTKVRVRTRRAPAIQESPS